MHLLCKIHTVKALDRSNFDVFTKIGKQVNQRGALEIIHPSLKSFFRGKKTVVECGIEALKLEALPTINKVLEKASITLEACQLYIETKLIITEFEVLTFFNHEVTFQFLNCIENCNQKDLLAIPPTLYHDLINNSIDTLSKYKLTMQQINIQEPDSKLSQKILKDFCLAAAEAIKTQCG